MAVTYTVTASRICLYVLLRKASYAVENFSRIHHKVEVVSSDKKSSIKLWMDIFPLLSTQDISRVHCVMCRLQKSAPIQEQSIGRDPVACSRHRAK